MCSVNLYLTLHLSILTAVPGDNGIKLWALASTGTHSCHQNTSPSVSMSPLSWFSSHPPPFWLLLSPLMFSPLPSLLNVSMPEIPGPLLTLHTPLVDLTCYQESGSPSLSLAPEPDLTLRAQDKTLFPSKLSLFHSSPAPDSPPCPTATPEPESSKGQTPNPTC